MITIKAGLFGTFSFSAIWEDEYEGFTYSAIMLNGKFFLPWHCAASIHQSGWMNKVNLATLVLDLTKMKALYKQHWYSAIQYANSLTGECVY